MVGPLYRDNCFVQEDNFTWEQHITSAEDKARRKMNIMRKLAGTEWGANEKVLKSVYQGNVRPYLEYGSSSWKTAAKTHHQTLDKVQNQALRIITDAMKSTPIQSIGDITNIPPLRKRRECKSNEYKIKTTFLRQTQEIELCIRDKSLTKKIPGSFHTEWSSL